MSKAKIALLSCGEAVYPQDWLMEIINDVKASVEKLDIELFSWHVIMDDKQARQVREAMLGKQYDLIVVHLVSWHITPIVASVLKEFRHIPVLIWGTGARTDDSGKIHSPASPAAITALLPIIKEMGFKYKVIYEKPDEPHKFKEVEEYAKIAKAYYKIRNSRVGLIGYADMGLYTCAYDKTDIFNLLGIEVEDYFSYEVGELMKAVPGADIEKTITWMKDNIVYENEVDPQVFEKLARLYIVMKKKAKDRDLAAISIKCVTGATQHMGVNPCMVQSMLANKDLNVICECDAHGLITGVMLSALTGKTSSFLENYEFFDDEILVGTCGFIPFDFIDGPIKAKSVNLGDFFVGMGITSKIKTGVVTFARLFKLHGKYKMFLSRGEAKQRPNWTELGWSEPTPTFPSIMLKLEMPVEEYVEMVPGQHIILVYGDYVKQMKELCKLFDLEIVP